MNFSLSLDLNFEIINSTYNLDLELFDRLHDSSDFGESPEPPDACVSRVAVQLAQIINHLVAMIRPHWKQAASCKRNKQKTFINKDILRYAMKIHTVHPPPKTLT